MWKDKLQRLFNYRRIEPSANVWDQLEKQLAAHEATQITKSKRHIWYYTAAASLLLILGTTYLLKQEGITANSNTFAIAVVKPMQVSNDGLQAELPKSITVKPIIKQTIPNAKPVNSVDKEVDSLLSDITTDELLATVMKNIEADMYAEANATEVILLKDLEKISANDLLLMASTEISLEKYVESQYNADKILSETEVEIFKDRVQRLLDKIVSKFNEAKLALKQ
ncbi:hypothetical protein [Capnocytophaga sp. oral taxon 878]|uniref:hypothetical protein n=1 Tax=Capnocytophaga sp. oral taxon 878 TaxID=1316596 RepID=UPI000D04122F|nr:hypothetical protein [Capnocytophaga sp. oral taxon 878]AVM49045.1 hypothetical protein C4H12_00375 [Capnocytophaga sp. oral taxon 878]